MSQTVQYYTVDKAETDGSDLQALEKLQDQARASSVPSFAEYYKCLKYVSNCEVLQLSTRKGQVAQPHRPWRSFQDKARAARVPTLQHFESV